MLPHLNGYFISAHGCLRGSSQFLAAYGNQDGSLGAGVLYGCSHEPVDKLFHDHLAGERLRELDHRPEIELFDRSLDRTCRSRRTLVLPQPRLELVELPYLSIGSPSKIALPRISQIEMRDLVE